MAHRCRWSGALALVIACACTGTLGACAPSRHRSVGGDAGTGDGATPSATCQAGGASVVCDGNTAIMCDPMGNETGRQDCSATSESCFTAFGCGACQPGTGKCDGNAASQCLGDGTGYGPPTMCDTSMGMNCNGATGTCMDLCAAAAASNSYIGCEYWPVTTTNSVSSDFDFAVVVTNPQTVPAHVDVTRGGSTVMSAMVAPGGVQTIKLPWVSQLKEPFTVDSTSGAITQQYSALVHGGAYHLVSSVPVTVYEFSPLEYKIDHDCTVGDVTPGDGQCFSYSNDASLLLPTQVLTQNYLVMAYPTQQLKQQVRDPSTGMLVPDPSNPSQPYTQWTTAPGFADIVGADASPVSVMVTFTAHTEASMDGSVTAFSPGQTGSFMLGQGDVLQLLSADPPTSSCMTTGAPDEQDSSCGGLPCTVLTSYCQVGPDYDLTGTLVRASGKVAVISGHQCTFVPYNRWACDHLEQEMFPLESWGKDLVVSATKPLRSEPNVLRVLSGADGNSIIFDPASVHGPVTLDRGKFIELQTTGDVRIRGTQALMVGQFLVGQDFAGIGSSGMMGEGDPSMSLAIPTEQFRNEYAFLAPSTYDMSFVNVTASSGQQVMFDGMVLGGWTPVGMTGMQTTRVSIRGGAHSMSSGSPFGIVVYGFGSYTSYMYPGGLDFQSINIPF